MPPVAVHRDVKASGVRLRVTEAGEGDGILFLHGLFVDHRCWNGVLRPLSERFRVVAPDLPGFGESEKPSPNRFPYHADAFTHAIADLYAGLDLGRATVVGHGFGGALALTLAARHPELISRLVLVDALCYPAAPDLARRIASLPVVGGFIFKQLWGRAAFRSYFREWILSPHANVSNETIDGYYLSFNTPASRVSALATLRTTGDTRAVVAHTSRVAAPTLVVWGRHDAIYPAGLGQRLAKDIRGAGFELMDTGHAPHEEQPARVAALIGSFCRSKRAAGS